MDPQRQPLTRPVAPGRTFSSFASLRDVPDKDRPRSLPRWSIQHPFPVDEIDIPPLVWEKRPLPNMDVYKGMPRRNILVIGATGRQGSAMVRQLLAPKPAAPGREGESASHTPVIDNVCIYALTRDVDRRPARKLLAAVERDCGKDALARLTLVRGNWLDEWRMEELFDKLANGYAEGEECHGDGLWGVFGMHAFPGLGERDDGERKIGIMFANLALKCKVKAFVYSTALQPAARDEDINDYSKTAKRAIELHCKSLTDKGLNWIILQPGFFMENFTGMLGPVAVTFLREGLNKDTTLCLIAADDIGRVAAAIFADHDRYLRKTIGLTSGAVTMKEFVTAYETGAGRPPASIPSVIATPLLKWNSATQGVIADIERHQKARDTGEFENFEQEVKLGQSIVKLQSVEEWARKRKEQNPDQAWGWNKLSLWKLVMGRS